MKKKTNRTLTFDRGSVRTYDTYGRLHVSLTNISKANVCPYYGQEIPNCEELGLDPDKIYQMYRDPEELAKAASTFNNVQLLSVHKAVSPTDPQKSIVVGSTGTDSVFQAPFLKNSLVIWDADAIARVEDDDQKELSCGYLYTADMTPGEANGVKYDGVMRNIVGNHVALVEQGRAGSDVVVGDTMEFFMSKKIGLSRMAAMAKGAIAVYLKPKLANDAKMPGLDAMLSSVTHANWANKKSGIVENLKILTRGKLAKDEDLNDAPDTLNKLDDAGSPEDDFGQDDFPPTEKKPVSPQVAEAANAAVEDNDGDPMEKIRAFLTGKLSDEDLAMIDQLMGVSPEAAPAAAPAEKEPAEKEPGNDDDVASIVAQIKALVAQLEAGSAPEAPTGLDDDPAGPPATPGTPANPTSNKESPVKPEVITAAMDSAIQKAVRQAEQNTMARMRAIAEAQDIVRPLIGEVMAQDSAEAVYRLALEANQVDLTGVPPAAFKAMVKMLKQPGEQQEPRRMAADNKTHADFKTRFPEASEIIQLG